MLSEIRIESLGAIGSAVAEFDRGLTVLTGETGTGKTMVVTGLHLLGGARADPARVRTGADRAVAEGRFSTAEIAGASQIAEILDSCGADRDEDGSIIASRSVTSDGRSRAYLGGRSVPAKSLSAFTTQLLTLHGQNDQLRLMRPDEQRAALDRYSGVAAKVDRYRKLRNDWLQARSDLAERTERARELAQEADRLKFAIDEISSVDPLPSEDNAIVADIHRLSELDALREAAQTARAALTGASEEAGDTEGAATALVGQAKSALEATDDHALLALAAQLSEALTLMTDVGSELTSFLDELPSDANALESKLARQAQLRTLTRKYAADVDGVLAWAEQARERLTQVDVSEDALAALSRTVDELAAKAAAAADDLTKVRIKAAKALSKAVTAELSGLAMADAEFTITVAPMLARPDDSAPLVVAAGVTAHAGSSGTDAVEFGFAAHKGAGVLPVNKSASGGELSRLMLALEVVLAASDQGTTMVFDEVDAGVGGRAAVQIGRRLARLARTHQVIVVTHLPQVAAYADVHLVVDTGGRNGTSVVRKLDDDGRVGELARMLAGLGESDTARAHARELLDTASGEAQH
ncbi:MAG: repair protein RecN [Mycobacterium sp.]|nr:repair protein RecN [Mycobacterium sp.]